MRINGRIYSSDRNLPDNPHSPDTDRRCNREDYEEEEAGKEIEVKFVPIQVFSKVVYNCKLDEK